MQNVASWGSSITEGETTVATDVRDNKSYTVARINNQLWMTSNLRFTGSSLTPETSNVNSNKTITWSDLTSGGSYDEARYHTGKDGNNNDGNDTVWYNYAGASAMSITGSASNTTEATESICPYGWRLPTNTESGALKTAMNADANLFSAFNPVAGGVYTNGAIKDTSYGLWWSSTAANGTDRYYLYYGSGGGTMGTLYHNRPRARFVRCVQNT